MTSEAPGNTTGTRNPRAPHPRLGAIWRGRGRPWFRARALLALAFFGFLGYLCYQAALWTALWGGMIGWAGFALLAGAAYLFWRAARSGWQFFAHLGLRGALILAGLPTAVLFTLSLITVGVGLGPRAWLMVGGIMAQQASEAIQPIGRGIAQAPDDITLAFTGRSFNAWFRGSEEPVQISSAQPTRSTAAPEKVTSTSVTVPVAVLRIGGSARVLTSNGSNLRVRRDPGTSQAVVARLRGGESVAIIGGPMSADGYTWWRVRGEWGEGWCAADFLEPTATP